MIKFLVDAQLPIRLKMWIKEQGFDAIHATDLPNREFTKDEEIVQ